jgi:ABC-type multidrug transport system fused ATPase/permease subunit
MRRSTLIKRFIRYLYPSLGSELLILLLMLIGGAGSLATPYFLKVIIDEVFPKGSYSQLVGILLLLVIIYIVRIVCSAGTDILYSRVSTKITEAIRSNVLSGVLAKPLSFFKQARSGELIYTMVNDVENIQTALSYLILHFLNNCIQIAGIVIMLSVLNFELTMISLLILPFILISIKKLTPHLQGSHRLIQKAQENLNTFFLEIIKNIRVITSYGSQRYESERLKVIHANINEAQIRNATLNSLNSNITTFFVAIGPVIVLMYGGKDVFKGVMSIGSLIAFIQYLNRLYSPTISVMDGYNHFVKAIVSMEKVAPFIMGQSQIPNSQPTSEKPVFRSIIFDKVSFDEENTSILKNINLRFEKGRMYALIGPSGAGKSTIVNLLCGFIKPDSGRIYLDNERLISEYKEWRSCIGLVEKENQLFNDTVSANIRYGSFQKSDLQVKNVIDHAVLRTVIDQLKDKNETLLNESGLNLSDGQKQRISIARAFLRNPAIFIFDEATSSLDIELEQAVFNSIKKYYPDSILLVVTHRIASLHKADYYYKIEEGTIVDEGNPKILKSGIMR